MLAGQPQSFNTASSIILRDGSGNFSAGTITANLIGNLLGNVSGIATTANNLQITNDLTDTSGYLLYSLTVSGSSVPVYANSNITVNPVLNTIGNGSTNFNGNATSATSAITSTNLGITSTTTSGVDYLLFATTPSGSSLPIYTNSNIIVNPNTNTIGNGSTNINGLLNGNTWISPGTIGSTTPNTGAFTTVSATNVTATNVTATNVTATTVTANIFLGTTNAILESSGNNVELIAATNQITMAPTGTTINTQNLQNAPFIVQGQSNNNMLYVGTQAQISSVTNYSIQVLDNTLLYNGSYVYGVGFYYATFANIGAVIAAFPTGSLFTLSGGSGSAAAYNGTWSVYDHSYGAFGIGSPKGGAIYFLSTSLLSSLYNPITTGLGNTTQGYLPNLQTVGIGCQPNTVSGDNPGTYILDVAGSMRVQGLSYSSNSLANTLGSFLTVGGGTVTDTGTGTTGTLSNWAGVYYAAPILAALNPVVTTTNASTLYIAGPPTTTASGNETITNSYTIYTASGNCYLGNTVTANTFKGSLIGNVLGNVSGTSGTFNTLLTTNLTVTSLNVSGGIVTTDGSGHLNSSIFNITNGISPTVAVGTTTTLPSGSNATVTNSGTASGAIFNFGIPAGSTWWNGSGIPVTVSGAKVGDYYLATSNSEVYTEVSGNTWTPLLNLNGGSLPTYNHLVISILNFGYSSDASNCFTQSGSPSPYYWAPGSLPPTSNVTHNLTASGTSFGTVAASLPANNYMFSMTFLSSPGAGIAYVTINGAQTTYDTYTSNTSNATTQLIIPFTVSGTGYQQVLIKMAAHGKNAASSGYNILPSSHISIDTLYTL